MSEKAQPYSLTQNPPEEKPKAKRMTFKRQVKRMIVLLVIAYVALCVFALTCADRVLFQPHPAGYQDDAEILKLKTADGVTISAIYLPNPSAKYTILFSHGNGEDLGDPRYDKALLDFAKVAEKAEK